ncbi:MAG: hypothetical protein FalmKO_29690 [Falsiruegeria mediterranea]
MHSLVPYKDSKFTTNYLDGFVDETNAAGFLCLSRRTVQKRRVNGAGPIV